MQLLLDNLPSSLKDQRETLARCLAVMDSVQPISAVYLFGSHVRDQAGPGSDVDLCIVAEGADRQSEVGSRYYSAIWDVWPRPALTLIPISPARLEEKRAIGDHFFATVLKEGRLIAAQD